MVIRVNFCDFWPGFEANNLFIRFLENQYTVTIDERPDYLFYSVYGNKHLEYGNCIKILYTGENIVPDFNLCDYAMGFHYIDFGDRYLRFPLHAYYQWHYSDVLKIQGNTIKSQPNSEELINRKFCNFVYSNNINADPIRDAFFHQLSKYRKIDSGGRHLNNIGGPIPDKLQFIKDYKFTIAFENSSVPGYTTEKLLEPIMARSLPIYFGNPLVNLDFNADSIIQVKGASDFDRAIEEIVALDRNANTYIEKLNQQKFSDDNTIEIWEEKITHFFANIFGQPQGFAARRPVYGFNSFYFDEMKLQADLVNEKRRNNQTKARIKIFFNKFISHLEEKRKKIF